MSPLLRKILAHNLLLTAIVAGLVAFGIHAIRIAGEGNPSPSIETAWRSQLVWAVAGAGIYLVAGLIDYRLWVRWASLPGWLLGVALLVFLVIKGEDVNDTRGWLQVAGLSVQPSQLAMAAAILCGAACLGEWRRAHGLFRLPFVQLALIGVLMGLPCLLVLLQGDVGSALVWLPVTAALCLVGNIPFRHLMLVTLGALTVLPLFYFFGLTDQRRERIEVWLDMLEGRPVDVRGPAYAAYYTSTAVGSGGWNGFYNRAPGQPLQDPQLMPGTEDPTPKQSIHSLGLIPLKTVHNDFIFAVVGERFGFRGSALLILAFCALLLVCFWIAYHARDLAGRLVATGAAALVFAHMFQNIGMVVLLTPITGIPLPFVSYGGTFTVVMLFLMGAVQSVWVHRDEDEEQDPQPATQRGPSLRGLLSPP
jgi:rod shape determining protein RodA